MVCDRRNAGRFGFCARAETWRPFVMPWQTVRNLPTRCHGTNKDVQRGANHRIIVEQARGDAHRRQVWSLASRSRATYTAPAPKTSRSGFATRYRIATPWQPFADLDVYIAGERRSGRLPAIDAMAMRQRSNCLDLEANTPTETGSPNHAKHPSPYRGIVVA